MRFLGTGAADMIPSPFCNCPVCCAGRKDRRFNRLHSLFLLDRKTLIDFGPDLGAAAMKHGLDLSGVENVFATHTHEDHFALSNLDLLRMGKKEHMDVYLSTAAYATLMEAKECFGDRFYRDDFRAIEEGRVTLHPVEVGKQYSLGEYDPTLSGEWSAGCCGRITHCTGETGVKHLPPSFGGSHEQLYRKRAGRILSSTAP